MPASTPRGASNARLVPSRAEWTATLIRQAASVRAGAEATQLLELLHALVTRASETDELQNRP